MLPTVSPHQSLLRLHGLSHEPISIVLSSRMNILYASAEAEIVLRDLKGPLSHPDDSVPPAILAYIGQGMMKQIQLQRFLENFAPIFEECSVRSVRRLYHCSSLGIPSRIAIDEAKIILALREDRWTSMRLRPLQRLTSKPLSLWPSFLRFQSHN